LITGVTAAGTLSAAGDEEELEPLNKYTVSSTFFDLELDEEALSNSRIVFSRALTSAGFPLRTMAFNGSSARTSTGDPPDATAARLLAAVL
jgi:hypothetical protein